MVTLCPTHRKNILFAIETVISKTSHGERPPFTML